MGLPAVEVHGEPHQQRRIPAMGACYLPVQKPGIMIPGSTWTRNKARWQLWDPTIVPPAYTWHGKKCNCMDCASDTITPLPAWLEEPRTKPALCTHLDFCSWYSCALALSRALRCSRFSRCCCRSKRSCALAACTHCLSHSAFLWSSSSCSLCMNKSNVLILFGQRKHTVKIQTNEQIHSCN